MIPSWRRWARSPTLTVVVAVVAVVVPIMTAAVRALARGWMAIGDNGLLLLRTQDVGTSHHPWLGTWTSASLTAGRPINNPGPLWFEVLAPFVRILGPHVGLAIGVAVANSLAVVLAAWAARRAGGPGTAVMVTALSAGMAWSMGSELLYDAWQPHAMVLPGWALLVCLWALATGDLAVAPWAVAVASLIVQTHLSFVYVTALVGLAAIAGAVLAVRRARNPVAWRRPVLISLGIAALAWLQPLIDQVAGEGNLGALASAGRSSGDPIGVRLGVRLIGSVVALPPWWTRAGFSGTIASTGVIDTGSGLDVVDGDVAALGPALIGLVVIVGGLSALAASARRRHDRPVVALAAIAGTALAASIVSTVLSPVNSIGLSPHQLRWLWPTALVVWAVPTVAVARWVEPRRVVVAVATAVAVVLGVVNLPTHAAPEGPTADRAYQPTVAALVDQLADYDPAGPVVFDMTGIRFAEPYTGPIIAALARQGVDVRFTDDGMVRQVGRGRRADGDETRRLVLLEGPAVDEPPAGATTVARVDGLATGYTVALFDAPR